DLMFTAVERPGKAAAVGRNLKSKARIGDHIDPRRGGRLSRAQNSHVFAPSCTEPPQAVEEFEILRRGCTGWCLGLQDALHRPRSVHDGLAHAIQLIGEVAAPRY